MAESAKIQSLADLRLSTEDREKVAQLAGDLIAVNVYRELQRYQNTAAKSDSGCNIAGNCCCSSKADMT